MDTKNNAQNWMKTHTLHIDKGESIYLQPIHLILRFPFCTWFRNFKSRKNKKKISLEVKKCKLGEIVW